MATIPTLHYIFDPLCGWCYGVAPLIKAAQRLSGLQIALHGGGMLTGAGRRVITPELRNYIMAHDQRIAALTGQTFGLAYTDGLLQDPQIILDSEPPTTAILAAQAVASKGLDMLQELQQAHYEHGLAINQTIILQQLAQDLGINGPDYAAAYKAASGAPTLLHIETSRKLLRQLGRSGFPTLALEHQDALTALEHGAYLGRPKAWQTYLNHLLAAS